MADMETHQQSASSDGVSSSNYTPSVSEKSSAEASSDFSSSSDKMSVSALDEMQDTFPESDAAMDERLSRLRELKTRLGSPAESVGADSVASGQFDDVESIPGAQGAAAVPRKSRSRTVSSSSSGDRGTSPVMSPLQDLVIPLPDSSEVMQAKYASLDNLHNSPIPLPDPSGLFLLRSEECSSPTLPSDVTSKCSAKEEGQNMSGTEAHSYSINDNTAHQQKHRKATTTGIPASPLYTGEAIGIKSGSTACTGTHSQQTRKQQMDSTTSERISTETGRSGGRAYPGPLSKEPYTPGSYLANRERYIGKEGVENVSSFSSSASTSSSSSSQRSEQRSQSSYSASDHRKDYEAHAHTGYSDSVPDIKDILNSTAGLEKHILSEKDLRSKRETASATYASSSDLRESLVRESMSQDSMARDSQSRDGLVREVLAREAKEREMKEKPPSIQSTIEMSDAEQYVPIDVVLDKGRLSAIRETLKSEPSIGYSLKDYKNYVAQNYGEDEAARIRDRIPQPFSSYDTSYKAGFGDKESSSHQPYYISENKATFGDKEGPRYQPYYIPENKAPYGDKEGPRHQPYYDSGNRAAYGDKEGPRHQPCYVSDNQVPYGDKEGPRLQHYYAPENRAAYGDKEGPRYQPYYVSEKNAPYGDREGPRHQPYYVSEKNAPYGDKEGPRHQPYYVSEDTQGMSSEKVRDYLGRKTDHIESERSNDMYGSRSAGSSGYVDLESDESYTKSRRAESTTSDRSYTSDSYSSAGQRSSGYGEGRSSSSEQGYHGRPSEPGRTTEEQPRMHQYRRSYSGDSTRSSYKRTRQTEPSRRRSLFDRPSLFDRDGIMDLLDDLLFDDRPNRQNLWDRHSSLLKDDDFCRDFFTKDWDWPSAFDDDDFFKDSRRRSKTVMTETKETREEGDGRGRIHRTKRTESQESDMSGGRGARKQSETSKEAPRPESSSSSSSGASQSSTYKQKEQSQRDSSSGHQDPAGGGYSDSNVRFSNLGRFDEEAEDRFFGRGAGRGRDRTEHHRQSKGDAREENREEHREQWQSRRGEGLREGKGGLLDEDTLFYKDFDDLIRRFKDLKWKSAMESYQSSQTSKQEDKEPSNSAKE